MIQLDVAEFDLHKAVEDVVYGMSDGGLACDVSCVIGMDVPRMVRGTHIVFTPYKRNSFLFVIYSYR